MATVRTCALTDRSDGDSVSPDRADLVRETVGTMCSDFELARLRKDFGDGWQITAAGGRVTARPRSGGPAISAASAAVVRVELQNQVASRAVPERSTVAAALAEDLAFSLVWQKIAAQT